MNKSFENTFAKFLSKDLGKIPGQDGKSQNMFIKQNLNVSKPLGKIEIKSYTLEDVNNSKKKNIILMFNPR